MPASDLAPLAARLGVLTVLARRGQFPDPRYVWAQQGRPSQQPPPGDWRTWLILAGRGWGKTRTGAEWVRASAESGLYPRIALVAPTAADARDVMVEGESGLLAIAPPHNRPTYEPSKRRITWNNGVQATTYSADEPDRLRGPQHHAAWCLARGTLVRTADGWCPIEQVRAGMLVETRYGPRRVTSAGQTGWQVPVVQLRTSTGETIVVTPHHRFWVEDQGWVPCDGLTHGDTLCAWKHFASVRQPGLSGAIFAGIATGTATTRTAPAVSCTSQCGSALMAAVSMMAMSFTTRTATLRTTPRATWLWSRVLSTLATMWGSGPRTIHGCYPRHPSKLARALTSCGPSVNPMSVLARAAANATGRGARTRDSVIPTAVRPTTVVSVEPSGRADVYDLTVDGAAEFFAGGLLVHNSDEVAVWKFPEAFDMLQLGLRLGTDPRQCVTTTPRPVKLLRDLLAQPTTTVVRGTTYENAPNLAPAFLEQVITRYEGTRLGRQELQGELLDDAEGALWQRRMFDTRKPAADLRRIVVAIDPAATSTQVADETGIIVAGVGVDGQGYVLADRSCRLSPDGWARRAIAAFDEFRADRVVVEVNQGGDMVSHTLRTVRRTLPIKTVHASRGKIARAEPVAALYEQARVWHTAAFDDLEDQLCTWTPASGQSPDRLDALVWALTDLLVQVRRWGAV